MWSKTIRGSEHWTFAPACPGRPLLCIARTMRQYLAFAKRLCFPASGFLLMEHSLPTALSPGRIAVGQLDPANFNRRIQKHLAALGLFAGESIHDLRAGRPIERALWAGDANEAFGDNTWATVAIGWRYAELVDVMVACCRQTEAPHSWEHHEARLESFRELNLQNRLASAASLLHIESDSL